MNASSADSAVFFNDRDYVGVGRRLLIDAIDAGLVWLVSVVLTSVLGLWTSPLIIAIWVPLWFGYFVVLKRSRFRTLGYLAAGARIVDMRGQRPGYLALTARLLFVVAGPVNFLLDLLWVSSDPCRQALRDKVAHTFVVRAGAQPVGAAKVVYRTYTVFGGTLIFAELLPDA